MLRQNSLSDGQSHLVIVDKENTCTDLIGFLRYERHPFNANSRERNRRVTGLSINRYRTETLGDLALDTPHGN